MKKMKGAATIDRYPSTTVHEDPKIRFKHQILLQEYVELQKETDAMKAKLQTMKQKKSTLLAEVRFLRRRREYLKNNQSLNFGSKQAQNIETKTTNIKKGKNVKKEASPRQLTQASVLNQRQRIYNGEEASLRKSMPIFDLNQKIKISTGKGAGLVKSSATLDFNRKERIHSGKEAAKRTLVFDLNQISIEEEESKANFEVLRMDEPNKSLLRSGIDEQQNDTKISVCRNVGNSSSRAGKRKISWQDQVALRV